METATENKTFKYKGFDFEIIERPDKYYLYQVRGYNSKKEQLFNPPFFFEKNLSPEQIRAAVFLMMDGKFKGEIEVYGELVIIVSFDIPFQKTKNCYAGYGVQIMKKIYYRLMFFLVCRLWPRITRKEMWYMTMTPKIADPDGMVTIQIIEETK